MKKISVFLMLSLLAASLFLIGCSGKSLAGKAFERGVDSCTGDCTKLLEKCTNNQCENIKQDFFFLQNLLEQEERSEELRTTFQIVATAYDGCKNECLYKSLHESGLIKEELPSTMEIFPILNITNGDVTSGEEATPIPIPGPGSEVDGGGN